jgi:hypothetical protein
VDSALEEFVRKRADYRCEYCRIHESLTWLRFQFDHVIPRKHGGQTVPENLARACFHCNSFKGPNIAGIDPLSGAMVPLFNPRQDAWEAHFAWQGPTLVGLTPVGRATIQVLWLNHPRMVDLRASLLAEAGPSSTT